MGLFKRNRKELYDYLEVIERPNSFTSESIKKMIVNLEYANIDKKYKAIQITSSFSGEGKTTLAGNMSILLAKRKHKVILLDLDLRKPKVHKLFNFPNDIGVANYLHGSATLDETIKKTKHGVDVLVAGEKTDAVFNLLQSDKLTSLIEELKENYDYILIDTPPVQVNSDAIMISKLIDGVLFVIGYNRVKKNIVKDSANEFKRHKTPIIGSVLTQVKSSKKALKNNYYYGD